MEVSVHGEKVCGLSALRPELLLGHELLRGDLTALPSRNCQDQQGEVSAHVVLETGVDETGIALDCYMPPHPSPSCFNASTR